VQRSYRDSDKALVLCMAKYKVVFRPIGWTVEAEEGETLLEVAARAGIQLLAQCGGQGTCGRCEVLCEGEVKPKDPARWDPQVERGRQRVLACQALVAGDLVVEVPMGAVPQEVELSAAVPVAPTVADFLARHGLSPLVHLADLRLSPPSTTDNSSDLERLTRALSYHSVATGPLKVGLSVLQDLPARLREANFEVTTIVADTECGPRLIDVRASGAQTVYGLAVDVGTTTIVAELLDLSAGVSLGRAVQRNPQARYGADVISRIIWSEEESSGLEDLRSAVLSSLNGIIAKLCDRHGVAAEDIVAVSCAGNTTMTSLMLGIQSRWIRRAPHIPPAKMFPVMTAERVGLEVLPSAPVLLAPAISGFVGGDIAAGVLATGMTDTDELCMLVDVGTNGEIVVGNRDWLACASCSAGPAFEGVGIDSAMPAIPGAIEGLSYDREQDAFEFSILGDGKAVGICGTGLLEALGVFVQAGITDRAGRFDQEFASPRMRERRGESEFVLVWGSESASGEDLVLRQGDLDNLIRSKAAIHAGITVALKQVGLDTGALRHVYLAGAFGNHLDISQAIVIGMLPDLPREQIHYVGNTSLVGARLMLCCAEARRRTQLIAERMTYVELGNVPEFMDEFVASMFLPHTDLGLYPSLASSS